jgi:hypothetical protein
MYIVYTAQYYFLSVKVLGNAIFLWCFLYVFDIDFDFFQ